MLGKLLKYEIKSTARLFLPIYIAILVMSLGQYLFTNESLMNVKGIVLGLLVALIIGLFVFTIVIIIQRFNKNLLGDEGYLTFTLPVSVKNIVVSKLIASIIYTTLSVIISIISFNIIVLSFSNGQEILSGYRELIGYISNHDNFWALMYFMFMLFISNITFILLLYLSISMGQIQKFNNHRVLVGFITYFIINALRSGLEALVQNMTTRKNILGDQLYMNFSSIVLDSFSIWVLLLEVVLAVLFFLGTTYILEKKLNLE